MQEALELEVQVLEVIEALEVQMKEVLKVVEALEVQVLEVLKVQKKVLNYLLEVQTKGVLVQTN